MIKNGLFEVFNSKLLTKTVISSGAENQLRLELFPKQEDIYFCDKVADNLIVIIL